MGLKIVRSFLLTSVAIAFGTGAYAAPMLRLVTSTVGPVSAVAGINGPSQTVEAYNAGDGTLSLTMTSSVSWIVPTVGTARACTSTTNASSCIPLQLGLSTGSLTAASSPYTGVVTVTSSNANTLDAPQTITVTVQIGGGVPSSVDVYAAPGGTREVAFWTNSLINGAGTTTDGNKWLSLVLNGIGSFRFNLPYSTAVPYNIQIAPQAGNVAGSVYNGNLTISGSTFSNDNRTVPVTMRVTSQPIAQASTNQIAVRLAQGEPALAPPFSPGVSLANVGASGSSLVAQTPTVTGQGISYGSGGLTFDTTGLSPGNYTGAVALPSNAVNGTVTVPVLFQVLAKSNPWIYYQGVQDNATFIPGDTVAQGDVAVIKGEQLSFNTLTMGQAPPMSTQVADVTVTVNGEAAPIYYTLPFQIAFQIPVDTQPGVASVQLTRTDGSASNLASVTVAARAPKLVPLNGSSWGAIVNQDGSLPVAGAIAGWNTHPAKVGDWLTIYAIGLGPTNPVVATGQPAPSAEPLARLTSTPVINFGGGLFGILATPAYAGLSPTSAGLYQINVQVPPRTPSGTVLLTAVFPDSVSNAVFIAVQ